MDLETIVGRFRVGGGDGTLEQASPDALLEYVEQIQNVFAGDLVASKLDNCLGVAFPDSETDGLLAFLRKNLTEKRLDKVKENVFNLIQYILVQRNWMSDVNRFCIRFKIIADMYWKHSKVPARLQQAALDCLTSLFENFGGEIDLIEFEASRLFWELLPRSEKSSYQPTVRGKMFHLMGILGAIGRDNFMKSQAGCFKKLFNHIIETIRAQVDSSDAHLEVSILLGCLKGLNQLLDQYWTEVDEDTESWVSFQDYLERIIDPSTSIAKREGKAKIKRREFQRAALEFIANHGELIKTGMFEKHRQWFEDLLQWSKSSNADDNRIGRKAMNKYLDIVIELAESIKDSNSEEMNRFSVDHVKSFLTYFSQTFKNILTMKDANRIELGIAVRGYGMLSIICPDQSQALEMLNLIMEHINRIIQELDSPNFDKYSASISILTTYLESVASILPSLKSETGQMNISEEQVDLIKHLTVLIIKFFPEFSEGQRYVCHISVQKIFDSLWDNHHVLCEPFIEDVYRQGMLHIVSGPTRAEIDILIEAYNRNNPDSKKSAFRQLGLKPVTFYVPFFRLLLGRGSDSASAILRFDVLMQWILSTIEKLDLTIQFENEKDSDNSSSGLDPMQGATATVIKDFQIFVNLVDFFQELLNAKEMRIHTKFEKWVTIFAEQMLTYVRNHAYVSGFYKILAVVFDSARNLMYFDKANEEKTSLREKLNLFFRRLGTKINEFRDDLLFAVLELWLSLPDTLIISNLKALDSTLQTVFTTGRNSFALANKGLEAMERWFIKPEFPIEEIHGIINHIFPILKTYFIHSDALADSDETTNDKSQSRVKGGLKSLIKKKVQSKSKDGTSLKATQTRILQFIGHFGQYIEFNQKEHSGLSKDGRFLHHEIPFQDCKPGLYLDDFLPRILDLCENAVERQTRVSACEFFHTLSIIFIGNSQGTRDEKYRKDRLFKEIFESMLKLGCDSDIVIRQLFNPLCVQTVHWFSKKGSPYGSLVLDILMKNLAQNRDSTLRELGAMCVGEYFQWCIKHQNSDDAKVVLKTIIALSTHASEDFRQGSVLAFNSIYRDFREEKTYISESFNLLYSFLTSLKLSKDLPEDSLLVTSTIQAIKHLERILVKKKDWFNTAIRPRHFKPISNKEIVPCLKDVVEWLLWQGGDAATVYRTECLRLVTVLSACVRDIKSISRCLEVFEEKHGLNIWIQIGESTAPSLEEANNCTTTSFLNAASQYYSFLFEHDMLNKRLFFSNAGTVFCKSLLNLCTRIRDSNWMIPDEEKIEALNVFTKLKFAWKIFNEDALAQIWSFSMELSQRMGSFYSSGVVEELVRVWSFQQASEKINSKCIDLLILQPIQSLSQVHEHANLLHLLNQSDWFRIAAENGILRSMLPEETVKDLKEKLWNSVNDGLYKSFSSSTPGSNEQSKNLSLSEKKILENYLTMGLHLGLAHKLIVDSVFDSSNATQHDGTFQLTTTKGTIFQKQLTNALIYCDSLFNFDTLLHERPIKDVGEMIQRLIELIKSNKKYKNKFGAAIYQKCISNWNMISVNCEMSTAVKIFVGLVAVNGNECRNSKELSDWWNGRYLMQARHLDLKQKTGVFGYASVFISSNNKAIADAATQTVTSFVQNDLKTDTLDWENVEEYIVHILIKLLQMFEQVPSNLNLLLPILSLTQKTWVWSKQDIHHSVFRLVRNTLEKVVSFSYSADSEKVDMASRLYEMLIDPVNKAFVESTSVWKCSILPVISSLNERVTKTFFKRHIYSIITTMEIHPKDEYDWRSKTLAVNLLELMIYQTSADFIKCEDKKDREISISAAYWNSAPAEKKLDKKAVEDPKTVYKRFVKVCVDLIVRVPQTAQEENAEFKLQCIEACYNTIVATLLETKVEYKLFNKFLFPGKKTFENIVNKETPYHIPVVIDGEIERSSTSLFSRRTIKKGGQDFALYGNPAVLNLLPKSGSLIGSSLEPDAVKFDFTSYTVADSEFYQHVLGKPQNTSAIISGFDNNSTVQDNNAGSRLIDGALEWSEINEHSCMFAFVESLKYMSVLHRAGKDDGDPQWPKTLASVLKDKHVHKNVKLFVVGGIINAPDYVEPFAAHLVEPIVQLILADLLGTIALNHFVQDTIICILSWKDVEGAKPKSETVTDLIKYIVRHVSTNEEIYKRNDLFRHIMEILKNIVLFWVKDLSEIPQKEIESLVNKSNLTEEVASIMLNISLSILLGGKLPHADTEMLLKKYMKACTSRFKSVHITAAKCLGLLLRKSKSEAPQEIHERFVEVVVEKISTSKTKALVFVDLLSAIQENFPSIIVKVKSIIFELCRNPKVQSDLLSLLPLLLKEEISSVTEIDDAVSSGESMARTPQKTCGDDFFTDIKGRGFFSGNQSCRSENDLNSAVDLLDILVGNTSKCTSLLEIVDWIKSSAEATPNTNIKVKFAKVLHKLYFKIQAEAITEIDSSTNFSNSRAKFFKIFIRLYEDENEAVQDVVHEFWKEILARWYQSSAHLLLELFDLIGEEEHPLQICLGIILQRCSLAPDYSKLIFREPLEKCDFAPFQLDTSWRLRHSSFQPLFAESLSTAPNFTALPRTLQSTLLSQRRSVGKFGMNVLRATLANLQFTPTQQNEDGNGESSYVGGVPMEIDNYTQNFQPAYLNIEDENSFLSIPGNQEHYQNIQNEKKNGSPANPILKLRRKFYTRKDAGFYAAKVSEKQSEKKEEAREMKLAKISGVKAVRTYRIGELPDIMIEHSDLLRTLTKVAKLDVRTGQKFIFHLYNGMIAGMNPRDAKSFLTRAKEVFDRVLRNSITCSDRTLSSLLIELSVFNDVQVPTNVMLDVCKLTFTQKLGILKVEKQLLTDSNAASESRDSKRMKVASVPIPNAKEVDLWLGLAEMYKEVEEYDVLRNIFIKIQNSPFIGEERKAVFTCVGDALYYEGKGNLEEAISLFDRALDQVNNSEFENLTTKYFLEDSMMHCLTKLGDWSTLFESTHTFEATLSDDILQDQNAVERLIPFRMPAGIHLSLRYENDNMDDEDGSPEDANGSKQNCSKLLTTKFGEFMTNILSTEEGTNFLSVRYPFDACAWLLVENEEDYSSHANLMLERGYEMAINKLKSFDALSLKKQKQVLVSLQQSAVIADYMKWRKVIDRSGTEIEQRTKWLVKSWQKNLSYQPMDLNGSEYISAHRDYFVSNIGVTLEDKLPDYSDLIAIQKLRVQQDIWLADLGIFHRNNSIAKCSLHRLKESRRSHLMQVEFRKSMARYLTAFSEHIPRDDWCKQWCSIWKKLGKICGETEMLGVSEIKADLLHSVLHISSDGSLADVMPIISTLKGSEENLTSCIVNAAEELMNTFTTTEESANSKGVSSASLYLRLFNLLKKLTKDFSDADEHTSERMMVCLLKGCLEGTSNEMLMFANVFSLLKKFPETLSRTFSSVVETIPTYLFLPWIDQIMTAYKSSPQQYSCFKNVIDRLVKEFPQAFQIQYPDYLKEGDKLFAKSLKAVVLPHKLHEKSVNGILFSRNQNELKVRLANFQSSLQEIINNVSNIYGEYHLEYAEDMFQVVNNFVVHFQVSSQESESRESNSTRAGNDDSVKKCKSQVQRVAQEHAQKRLFSGRSERIETLNLEKLSPFLANFHFFEHDSIEKPGLYENFKPPRVYDHSLIVSFHPTVYIYSSLTKPLKLTVLTNDGKRSNFLAKMGDDIRQDRRIQQLFKVANVLFAKDGRVKQTDLAIQTYSCIPITEDFGIIEMVDNAMSLAEIIYTNDLKKERPLIMNEYDRWIKIKSGLSNEMLKGGHLHYYKHFAQNSLKLDTAKHFELVVNKLPKYILRDSIQERSSSLEEFFNIRQTTIRSYGSMCMVHWLLGIGDRHLENCILSMNTGKLVGIDFGRAFGVSNYGIPIPELVPFRLTPQLQQLMLPYTYQGLFRETCILAWTCLENFGELILAVADVFIQEPSIEWLQQRRKTKLENRDDTSEINPDEVSKNASSPPIDFPFEIMKRKLKNHNPTHLLLDELKKHHNKDFFEIYGKVAKDERIHLEKPVVTVEEHVDILLDLATDKNILHNIFHGWNSWA